MSKAAHATPIRNAGTRPQSEIARLAEEIARLWRLHEEIIAKRADDDEDRDDDLPDGRDAACFFEEIGKEALDRIKTLEHAASILEPETLDDVLTLMALLSSASEFFKDDYLSKEFDPEEFKFKKAERRIDRLRHAVIRGLMKFASSPLVRQRYVTRRSDGVTWEEELALAEAELAKLPVKYAEALDPADRGTHH